MAKFLDLIIRETAWLGRMNSLFFVKTHLNASLLDIVEFPLHSKHHQNNEPLDLSRYGAEYRYFMKDKSPISRRLKTLLANYLAQQSVLREIEDAFEGASVPYVTDPNASGGQRRQMVAGYYNGLNWEDPVDVRRFLDALQPILREADRVHKLEVESRSRPWMTNAADQKPEHPLASLLDELRRCGYEWNGKFVVGTTVSARLADAKAFAEACDLTHLGEHIQRIERAIDNDPAQAIGSAKELAETVAKTILSKRKIPFSPSSDLLELGKLTFKALKQLPDDVPDKAKGADTIKRMLSNLGSVVQGVAELRGLYGTGHGKDGKVKGLLPRHARLVVGAASTLSYYWLETDKETGTDQF